MPPKRGREAAEDATGQELRKTKSALQPPRSTHPRPADVRGYRIGLGAGGGARYGARYVVALETALETMDNAAVATPAGAPVCAQPPAAEEDDEWL